MKPKKTDSLVTESVFLNETQLIRKEFKEETQLIRKEFKEETQLIRKEFKEEFQVIRKEFKEETQLIRKEFKEEFQVIRKEFKDETQSIRKVIGNLALEQMNMKETFFQQLKDFKNEILNAIDSFAQKDEVRYRKAIVHDHRLNESEATLQNHEVRIVHLETTK